MTLYHFCPAHMVGSIKKNGLTTGKFPLYKDGKIEILDNCQWLTMEPDAAKQSWATSRLINYSRTEYRLTIEIPNSHQKKLVRAADYVKDMPLEGRHLIEDWKGSDKWYIYRGKIPAKWIKGCRAMGGARA